MQTLSFDVRGFTCDGCTSGVQRVARADASAQAHQARRHQESPNIRCIVDRCAGFIGATA